MYSYYMLLLLFVLVSDRSVSKPHCVKAAQTVCAWEEGWKSERKGSKAQRSDVLYIYIHISSTISLRLIIICFRLVSKTVKAAQTVCARRKTSRQIVCSPTVVSARETARKTQNQQRKTQQKAKRRLSKFTLHLVSCYI